MKIFYYALAKMPIQKNILVLQCAEVAEHNTEVWNIQPTDCKAFNFVTKYM